MLIIVGPEHRPRIRGKTIDACIHDQGRGAALKKYPEFNASLDGDNLCTNTITTLASMCLKCSMGWRRPR
jgi:hypothetical protein